MQGISHHVPGLLLDQVYDDECQPVGTQAAGPDARRQTRSAPQRPDLAVPPGIRAVLSEALRAKPTHDWEEGNMNAATFVGEYDVTIVGLGPTGLTLAHLLGRRGLKVLALEREPEFYGNARAVYTDDECMRVFQAAGVAADVEADMLLDTPVQWVLEDGSVLSQLRRTDRPYGWAVSNFFYQPYLETKMERLLARYPNVTVTRGRELVNFVQDEDGVVVEYAASAGSQYAQPPAAAPKLSESARVRAQWLVACDGGRSGVRNSLGIKMAGKSFPEPWLVVDIKAKEGEDCFRHMPYFNFHCDPKTPTVSCPQPNGHHRFEFLLM